MVDGFAFFGIFRLERIETKRDELKPPLVERPEPEFVDDSDTPWLLDLHSDR